MPRASESPSPLPASPPTDREIALRATAISTARTWIEEWFCSLAGEGRPVDGGWPGTVQEARARVANDVFRAKADPGATLSHEELGRLARVTNEEARRLWRAAAI